jgi:hypothetical protein
MAHTPDALLNELEIARRNGTASEINDLTLLLQNAERPKGAPKLPGAAQAANRQAQRRYQRTHTRDQNTARNPERRKPAIGDWVQVPNGERWLVTSIDGGSVRSDKQPGCPGYRHCSIGQVTIVDGPDDAPPVARPVQGAEEALYHAIWDVVDTMPLDKSRDALETVLRAYEARLAG